MTTKRRAAFIVLALLLALIGASIWYLYASFQHQQNNIALIAAIHKKDAGGVEALLNRGADPNSTETHGPPPSVWQLCRAFLDRLRGRGTQPKEEGPSALVLSVVSGKAEIVSSLLKKGARGVNARIDTEDDNGLMTRYSLVMYAARMGNTAILRALIDKGADVNARDASGTTALFVARNAASATLLIDHGADVNAKDVKAATALKAQMLSNHLSVIGVLIDRGARANEVMCEATELSDTDTIEFMLDKGVNPDIRSQYGETPLLAAITPGHGSTEIGMLLIQRGANVNVKDVNGTTPVMEAAEGDRYPEMDEDAPSLLKCLLDHRANINARDDFGETALTVASEWGRPVLVRILLQHGARVNARDNEGHTALSRAIASDYTSKHSDEYHEVVGLLKRYGGRE